MVEAKLERRVEMKHQHYMAGWASPLAVPGVEPIFFFDGDFRTWGQACSEPAEPIEQRARLNSAIASYIARRPMR